MVSFRANGRDLPLLTFLFLLFHFYTLLFSLLTQQSGDINQQ